MATSICGVHSTSPARPVDRHARGPPCSLVLSAPFTAGVSRRNAPATTYPVHLAVSRETHSEPSHWYGDSTDEIPLSRPRGQPQAPLRRRRIPNPNAGVQQPTARLRAERRHSAHTITCATEFCSSRQSVHKITSYSSLDRGPVAPPGKGSEYPVPARQYEPLRALASLPPAESERERSFSDSLLVSRETFPAQAHRS